MYERGRGVPQDDGMAGFWYRKAADQGNGSAQYKLGAMYADGRGVPRDYPQAAAWYRKAAEGFGQSDARYALGVMYANGQGLKKDLTQAAEWFRKAGEHAQAQNELAAMYLVGQILPEDYAQIVDREDAKALYNRAAMYETGNIDACVWRDPVLAVFWYYKAAEQGVPGGAVQTRRDVRERPRCAEGRHESHRMVPQGRRAGACPCRGRPRLYIRKRHSAGRRRCAAGLYPGAHVV
jgi:TPR repeat protein